MQQSASLPQFFAPALLVLLCRLRLDQRTSEVRVPQTKRVRGRHVAGRALFTTNVRQPRRESECPLLAVTPRARAPSLEPAAMRTALFEDLQKSASIGARKRSLPDVRDDQASDISTLRFGRVPDGVEGTA